MSSHGKTAQSKKTTKEYLTTIIKLDNAETEMEINSFDYFRPLDGR